MTDSKKLVQQAARDLEASKTTSTTAVGPTEAAGAIERAALPEEHVDAINQVFALFRLNYHNQFYAAYPDATQLNQVKKLWLEALGELPVNQILLGARHALETSEYLPTLNKMLQCCQDSFSAWGLPEARSAYLEACNAGSPKSAQAWSHPAVYLAGVDSDWFFLGNNPERFTWPVFREHYRKWCARVMAGEELTIPAPAALEQQPGTPSSPEQALVELEKIRAALDN